MQRIGQDGCCKFIPIRIRNVQIDIQRGVLGCGDGHIIRHRRAVEAQRQDDRVVVRRAVGIRRENRVLRGQLIGHIVVNQVALIRVNMPEVHIDHRLRQIWIRQSVVQVAQLRAV